MLGSACHVVRVFCAFAPCLEHVYAGGGGSVENYGFMIHDGVVSYMRFCITPYLYPYILHHSVLVSVLVRSDRCQIGCHGET